MTGSAGHPRPPAREREPAARPPGQAPECARLAEELRDLRKRTGLSLAALAERTPYSKSSWERYLNGKKQVPRQAVEALCRLAGERPDRLLVLWDLADAEWSGRGASVTTPAAAGTAGGDTASGGTGAEGTAAGEIAAGETGNRDAGGAVAGRPAAPEAAGGLFRWPYPTRRRTAVLAALCVTAAVAGALALGGIRPGGTEREAAAGSSTSATPSPPPPGCRGAACDGKDPESMGCGITVRTLGGHRTARGAGMEIRYSERCGAAWARIWQSRVGDRVRITAPGGRFQQAAVADRYDAEGYVYTPMIGAGVRSALRACHLPAPGGERECFDTTADGEETGDPAAGADAT
ncbi:XRE family transcriptional regulator [Streptomyces albus]|uniref:helix-turn-helix domain-containing protein n=1 Tax=Streptomyces albus TaxID=1888 RepID=UPI000689E3B0|nr:XRE family transcriptional regulator [Streptomyces albus]